MKSVGFHEQFAIEHLAKIRDMMGWSPESMANAVPSYRDDMGLSQTVFITAHFDTEREAITHAVRFSVPNKPYPQSCHATIFEAIDLGKGNITLDDSSVISFWENGDVKTGASMLRWEDSPQLKRIIQNLHGLRSVRLARAMSRQV